MFSIIFDMDGTLLDTQRICIPAWEYAGCLQGIEGLGEFVKEIFGMSEMGWTAHLVETYPTLDVPLFKETFRNYIKENGEVKFMPGAQQLLRFLKDNNVKVALASGTRRATVLSHLKRVGIENYFDAIVGGDEIKNGKPAPDIFLKAAELLNAKPDECIVFEDSNNGIKAAHNAGMKCIGIPDIVPIKNEFKKFIFSEINNLAEAIDILKAML